MTVHVFVGPTLAGRDVLSILPGSVVHPPIVHGDLLRLRFASGDVVVIIDGYYHQSASVRHKEIMTLLADGVAVIGCASMGALRAAELAEYGMIGSGAIYRMYRAGVLDADDEVAVAHGPAPDYRSFTVPLVVIRHAVDMAVRFGVLGENDAALILRAALAIRYSERSWLAVRRAVDATESGANCGAALLEFVESHPAATNIKAADALDTLRRIADGELPDGRPSALPWVLTDWRNRHVGEWRAEFAVSRVSDVEVSESLVVRYQQLYLDEFPARWERYALGRIADAGSADSGSTDEDLITRALTKAAQDGLTAASMTDAQFRYWLTGQEKSNLSVDEAMLRVLVRSYQPLHPTRDLIDDQPDLVADGNVRRVVAEAVTVNAEVASWGYKNTIDHLKLSVLQRHLADVWRIDESDLSALLAAARDRGFESIGAATRAARVFVLLKSFLNKSPSPVG